MTKLVHINHIYQIFNLFWLNYHEHNKHYQSKYPVQNNLLRNPTVVNCYSVCLQTFIEQLKRLYSACLFINSKNFAIER